MLRHTLLGIIRSRSDYISLEQLDIFRVIQIKAGQMNTQRCSWVEHTSLRVAILDLVQVPGSHTFIWCMPFQMFRLCTYVGALNEALATVNRCG